jgi:hypothetical protein
MASYVEFHQPISSQNHLVKLHFNTMLTSMYNASWWSFSFRISDPHVRYTSNPTLPFQGRISSFSYLSPKRDTVCSILMAIICVNICPSLSNPLVTSPLVPYKYSHGNSVLKHPQSYVMLQFQIKVSTLMFLYIISCKTVKMELNQLLKNANIFLFQLAIEFHPEESQSSSYS